MTEPEWLSGAELVHMEHFARGRSSGRKRRLFACACCRRLAGWFTDPTLAEALARAERFADGELTAATLRAWHRRVQRVARPLSSLSPDPAVRAGCIVCRAVAAVCDPGDAGSFDAWWLPVVGHRAVFDPDSAAYRTELPRALRCLLGNPFRPVAVDPAWRTSTVVALARGIYGERAFDRLPILADALQDAGCVDEQLLDHCRGPGPHIRGCWVVDLVLGKE